MAYLKQLDRPAPVDENEADPGFVFEEPSAPENEPAAADDNVASVEPVTTDSSTLYEADDAHSAIATHPLARPVVAALTFVLAMMILLPNMPESPLRRGLDPALSALSDTGYQQNWYVFSPNPISTSRVLTAELEYSDGTVTEWTLPEFDPVLGAFRQFRWNKYGAKLMSDEDETRWQSAAEWLARENNRNGEAPVRITLSRSVQSHNALGTLPLNSDWETEQYFTWENDQ